MGHNLELDWIDPMTAHVANRTGRAVFDVKLAVIGSVTVEGKNDWSFAAEMLPDGEFIALRKIKKDVDSATAAPFLEMSWRGEDSGDDSYKRVPLRQP